MFAGSTKPRPLSCTGRFRRCRRARRLRSTPAVRTAWPSCLPSGNYPKTYSYQSGGKINGELFIGAAAARCCGLHLHLFVSALSVNCKC